MLAGLDSSRPVRLRSVLAWSEEEQALVLQVLCSERFADTAPAVVHATWLDEGCYLGSVRTTYRLLAANANSAERRRKMYRQIANRTLGSTCQAGVKAVSTLHP